MISNKHRILCALSVIILAAAACSLPTAGQATPATTEPVAPVLAASSTLEPATIAPTDTPQPPTETLVPTETQTPAATLTATLEVGILPSETPSPTNEPVTAEVMKETNCRTGPAGNYDLVTTFPTGTKLQMVARDLGGAFIYVQNPDKPEELCYILANNARVSGDPLVLPQISPMPSPTAAPNFTAKFKKFGVCKAQQYAMFDIVNTGSVPFRSAYIRTTNLKTNESTEKSVNAFDLYTECIIAKNIAPLAPGAAGYLAGAPFLRDPRSDKVRAVIQVCTEQGLKGICVNTVIEIKP
jgi:hypothetical protein